jgi:hypothetical protein
MPDLNPMNQRSALTLVALPLIQMVYHMDQQKDEQSNVKPLKSTMASAKEQA